MKIFHGAEPVSVISHYCKCSSKGRILVSSVPSQHIFQFIAVDTIRNGTQLENLTDKILNVLFSLIHEFDCISFSSMFVSKRVGFCLLLVAL